MKLSQLAVTVVLATLALVGFAGVVGWAVLPDTVAAHVSGGHDFDGHDSDKSWRRGDRGDRCARFGPKHITAAQAMVAAHLDLNDEQEAKLDPLLTVVEAWREDVVATCQASIANTPDGLKTMQQVLERSAIALADMQLGFEDFYASLDDEQRAHMDRWVEHH